MTEQYAISQARANGKNLVSPLLYLSSVEAGWEGLLAQAFHEPLELESWISPAVADISLILFTGGAMRIERAQRLLTETDVPLARIAFENGFANQSHLTRAFKRHLGLTPRAYRQDHFIRADL